MIRPGASAKARRARSGQPGHLGIVRLKGKALARLRVDCYTRDKGICQDCGIFTYFYPRFAGDPEAYDMAHIVSRGAGGSDFLSNIRCLCHACHMAEHSGHPILPKPREETDHAD